MGTLYAAINVERKQAYYLGKSTFFHAFVQKLIETRGNVQEARIYAEQFVAGSSRKEFIAWADEFVPRVTAMHPDFLIGDTSDEWEEDYGDFVFVGTIFYDDADRIGTTLKGDK